MMLGIRGHHWHRRSTGPWTIGAHQESKKQKRRMVTDKSPADCPDAGPGGRRHLDTKVNTDKNAPRVLRTTLKPGPPQNHATHTMMLKLGLKLCKPGSREALPDNSSCRAQGVCSLTHISSCLQYGTTDFGHAKNNVNREPSFDTPKQSSKQLRYEFRSMKGALQQSSEFATT